LQEIATLRGKLADTDSRVNKERAERNQALLEKEQFRAHIHRLAKALKREREKTAATARRDLEQLRLEYVAREQRFILDGDRNELNKIKLELKALNEQEVVNGEEFVNRITKMASSCNVASPQPRVAPAQVPEFASPSSLRYSGDSYEEYLPQTPPVKEIKVKNDVGKSVADIEAEIVRLENEKNELLGTGVFDSNHSIINQLDRMLHIANEELSQAVSGQ